MDKAYQIQIDPMGFLESVRPKDRNNPVSTQFLFQQSEKNLGTKRYELDIFENYSSRIFNRNQFKPRNIREIGKLVTFHYIPEGYHNLPYYDIRPLVFTLQIPSNDMVIGMNFHYLQPTHRLMAFYAMYNLITDKNFGAETRIRLYYEILKSQKRFARNVVCIRSYKTERIRSQVFEIDPKYWETALVVPSQRFLRKRENTVYLEMNQKIRKILGNQ